MPRILSGRAFLDKLPFWLALPAGMALGLYVGYEASMPEVSVKRVLMALGLLAIVASFVRFAPMPARRRDQRPPGDGARDTGAREHGRGESTVERPPRPAERRASAGPASRWHDDDDDALSDESLCD